MCASCMHVGRSKGCLGACIGGGAIHGRLLGQAYLCRCTDLVEKAWWSPECVDEHVRHISSSRTSGPLPPITRLCVVRPTCPPTPLDCLIPATLYSSLHNPAHCPLRLTAACPGISHARRVGHGDPALHAGPAHVSRVCSSHQGTVKRLVTTHCLCWVAQPHPLRSVPGMLAAQLTLTPSRQLCRDDHGA